MRDSSRWVGGGYHLAAADRTSASDSQDCQLIKFLHYNGRLDHRALVMTRLQNLITCHGKSVITSTVRIDILSVNCLSSAPVITSSFKESSSH